MNKVVKSLSTIAQLVERLTSVDTGVSSPVIKTMIFVTIELNTQTRKEVAGSSPVGGIKNKIGGVL